MPQIPPRAAAAAAAGGRGLDADRPGVALRPGRAMARGVVHQPRRRASLRGSLIFAFLPRTMWLYVLGHEFTHALAAMLAGGKVTAFHVTSKGGHVLTDKVNWWIALSPYFVPIYALIWIALWITVDFYHSLRGVAAAALFRHRPFLGVPPHLHRLDGASQADRPLQPGRLLFLRHHPAHQPARVPGPAQPADPRRPARRGAASLPPMPGRPITVTGHELRRVLERGARGRGRVGRDRARKTSVTKSARLPRTHFPR